MPTTVPNIRGACQGKHAGAAEALAPAAEGGVPLGPAALRLVAGFRGGELLSYLQDEGVQIVLRLASRPVLKRLADPVAGQVREDYAPRTWRNWRTTGRIWPSGGGSDRHRRRSPGLSRFLRSAQFRLSPSSQCF